jgi:hypothetical protein
MHHLARLFGVLLLLAVAPAQVVNIANHTDDPFAGWHRLNVDVEPRAAGKNADGVEFRKGRRTGLDTWAVDVHVALPKGKTATYDLATFADIEPTVPTLPPPSYFGGWPAVNGTALDLVALAPDGAGWSAHYRARTGRTLVLDLWTTWYPKQAWAHAEALCTASNPAVPDLFETTTAPVVLTFGSARVAVLGGADGVLLPDKTTIADGQARAVALTLIWPSHLPTDLPLLVAAYRSALGDATWHVRGVGISSLLPEGNPRYPVGFGNPVAWARGLIPEAIRRSHTWEVGVGPGIPPGSGITGRQGDQWFVGGEALLPGGAGAELVTLLGAYKWAGRPCNFRESDGSMLNPALHTQRPMIFWDGRPSAPLWGIVEHLGKPLGLPAEQVPGLFWGPDVEHWMCNTLGSATRITGSPVCQELLRAQAILYPLQWTTTPGWSSSQAYAGRSVGYEACNAMLFWRLLEDRQLAERSRVWFAERRWPLVLRPALIGKDWPDARLDDPRLGVGWWAMPWQQSIESYYLDVAGERWGIPEMRAIALRMAKAVCDVSIYQDGGRWRCYAAHQVPPTTTFDKSTDNLFWLYGVPCAPATVLRNEPNNERARAIWNQMLLDATTVEHLSSMPPGVL